ncbi:MAG TPA: hypothetical protein ENH12_00305 [Proteobacteria bacterium]|nr:hypothetical protein [Pseudomonadota bacterium]
MRMIIFTIPLALLITAGCSGDSEESSAEKEKIQQVRYLPDKDTEGLKIAELSGDDLIELAGRREISPQNLALTLDRLKSFPGDSTILAAIPFIDRRDMIQIEILNTAGDDEAWELTEIRLGKVAISTLRAVTGENISNPEGWIDWYQDNKNKLIPTNEEPNISK